MAPFGAPQEVEFSFIWLDNCSYVSVLCSAAEGVADSESFLAKSPAMSLPASDSISKLVPHDWAINSDVGADKHTLPTPLRVTSTHDTQPPHPPKTHIHTHLFTNSGLTLHIVTQSVCFYQLFFSKLLTQPWSQTNYTPGRERERVYVWDIRWWNETSGHQHLLCITH